MPLTTVAKLKSALLVAAPLFFVACGADDADSKAMTTSEAGSAGTGGTASSGESAGASAAGAAGASAGTGGSDTEGPAESEFENVGECSSQGEGVFQDGIYTGWVELILTADEGLGEDLCVVRFDVDTVAEPEVPCDSCFWSTVVQLSNPVVTDAGNFCTESERGLDPATIEEMTGERIGIGYAPESTGHGYALMNYNEMTMVWFAVSFAEWDEETGMLEYWKRDSFCGY